MNAIRFLTTRVGYCLPNSSAFTLCSMDAIRFQTMLLSVEFIKVWIRLHGRHRVLDQDGVSPNSSEFRLGSYQILDQVSSELDCITLQDRMSSGFRLGCCLEIVGVQTRFHECRQVQTRQTVLDQFCCPDPPNDASITCSVIVLRRLLAVVSCRSA